MVLAVKSEIICRKKKSEMFQNATNSNIRVKERLSTSVTLEVGLTVRDLVRLELSFRREAERTDFALPGRWWHYRAHCFVHEAVLWVWERLLASYDLTFERFDS